MNRRNFLLAAPALALLPELIVPKRTIFLPPRGGWLTPGQWAVKTAGGYMYSNNLFEFAHNRRFDQHRIVWVLDGNYLTPAEHPGPLEGMKYRRWSGDYGANRTYSWEQDA